MWWPFKKREHELVSLKKSLELSFSNVKKDIESLKSNHHVKINEILERLDRFEKNFTQYVVNNTSEITESEVVRNKVDLFVSLTEKQKTFLRVLASLYLESSGDWISLKALAEELYPDKEYDKVRPMISQYLGHLEELGFAKKKRKGYYTYAITTNKNPYLQELRQLKPEQSTKKKDKKSKQS